MYLKELRINGFKSFAVPAKIELQEGMTAIVGPNGCGKSNIADAIRWVLGEQSAKSLRAGAMQDVIFQGTTNRKPLNLCEVTLLFTECEEQLGTDFKEVQITRRVVRDGGSDYFLNGKPCRLKDIHRLFLDTGVGQVSYSFMLQGQIDQVLSSNPAERRVIFEEAAGISRYKAQRREALSKLSQVDANLARVTDVIDEVSRQIGSLKRQASKAIRYKRVKKRLTHLDLALAAWKFQLLNGQIGEHEKEAKTLRETAASAHDKLNADEARLSQARTRRSELNERLQAVQQSVFELRSKRDDALNQSRMADIRIEDIDKRLVEIDEEIAAIHDRKQHLADRLAGESRAKEEHLAVFGESDEAYKARENALGAFQRELSEGEVELSKRKQALLMKENQVGRERSNCTRLEVELKSYQVRHANLTEALHTLKEQCEVVQKDAADFERTLEQRRKERETELEREQELREQGARLLTEFKEMQRSIQEGDRTLSGMRARQELLESLQAKFEGFSEGAKAILQGKLENTAPAEVFHALLSNLDVQPDSTHAIELLLGSAVDAIVLRDSSRLGAVAERLTDERLGRASLLVQPPGKSLGSSPSASAPAGLVSAISQVKSRDENLQRYVHNLFQGCWIAPALPRFLEIWQAHPEFQFSLVVTADGSIVDPRGLVVTGRRRGKEDESFLDRANQIQTLKRESAATSERLDNLRQQAEQIQARIDGSEKRREEQRRRLSELDQEIATLNSQSSSARKSLEEAQAQMARRNRELEELEGGHKASEEGLQRAQEALSQAESAVEQQKTAIEDQEQAVVRLREVRENLRERFNEARLEVAERKQRLEMLDRGLEEIEKQTVESDALLNRRAQESDALREQREEWTRRGAVETERAKEIESSIEQTIEGLNRSREQASALDREISAMEQEVSKLREVYEEHSGRLNKIDVEMAREQSQRQYLVEEIHREYDRELDTIDYRQQVLCAGDELPDRMRVDIEEESPELEDISDEEEEFSAEQLEAVTEPDWDLVEEELDNLRTRAQSMLPVNLLAIEEYRELRERYEFLKSQSDDLWKSKDQLLEAIDEINKTSQELFVRTFDQIRDNFRYTFETLFGGGQADLHLVDREDVLESGIDIVAQPPGTRLKSLALLSGGQKTMTAVALLFAIYMVKPSPFCVLDEIDAPLDDANIGRFCNMLERFLEFSQFLIITHNKRTIAAADTIYGATMQEKGVTRVVSMRFDHSKGEAEPAIA